MAAEDVEKVQDETVQTGADVEMDEATETAEGADAADAAETNEVTNEAELALAQVEEVVPARVTFASHLMSPIVTLIVGQTDPTILTAHQALLAQSPYFEDACKSFVDDGSVSPDA